MALLEFKRLARLGRPRLLVISARFLGDPPGLRRRVVAFAGEPAGARALRARRALFRQTFSTWAKSSSTGVARPKMVTDTRTLLFS